MTLEEERKGSSPSEVERTRFQRTVGLVTTYPSPERPVGGVATYSRHLHRALAESGLGAKVFAQRVPAPSNPATPAWDFGWSFLRSIKHSLAESPVEIVHIHHEPFLFGEGMAAMEVLRLPRLVKKLGAACVVTLHAVPLLSLVRSRSGELGMMGIGARAYLRLLGSIHRHVDALIVHEHEQARALSLYGRVPPERIAVIPHGISYPAHSARRTENGHFTLGSFGYFTPYKDYEYLLNEFSDLRMNMPSARLLLSLSLHPRRSNPRYRRRFARLIRHARSVAGVSVMGHLTDSELSRFLSKCDVIAVPYRYAVAASGVAATAVAAGVPALVPEGFGAMAELDGWSFPFVQGGFSRAAFRASSGLSRMRMRAREFAAERTWQAVSMEHRAVYGAV